MTNVSRLSLFAGILTILSAAAANAQSVSGSIANGTVTRGGTARATVYLTIPGGLHANSNRPGSEYAIPTSIKASAGGVRIGRISYPAGHNRKFEFSEKPINVYEGRVPMTFTITVPRSYRGNSLRVNVDVHYQACTNEVCYPPKSKLITLTANVR